MGRVNFSSKKGQREKIKFGGKRKKQANRIDQAAPL